MNETGSGNRFEQLFDLIGDPVVEFELVDQTPVVRAVNPAFEDIFGYDREQVLGESINDFIVPDDQTGEADYFDKRTFDGKHNTGLVTRQTATGLREFFYRGVPYERNGTQHGFAVYTDVTDQRRYERHFQVIHRLLRHDLRNNLQVVMGAAEQVTSKAANPEVADFGETIVDHADHLLDVGNETRIIERVLLHNHDPVPVDVAALCRSVAETQEETHPNASFETDLPESATVAGIQWLHEAIEALVENAAIHGGDHPSVRVSIEQRPDDVVVEVADDGPGIPPDLRAPVFDGQDITQLKHNRGIGLWLVRWVARACEGQIEYEESGGWTVVKLSLQSVPSTEEERSPGEC